MARGIHWQIQFKTIQEDLLTISIYHKNYSGAIVQLTGGSTPMVTEELKSDNILEPIRTQTGYINICCGRSTWLEVINSGEMVELKKGSTILWRGFISKEAFTGGLFNTTEEYQIPIHCVLTQLQAHDFVVSPFDMPTFAKVMYEGFALIGVGPDYLYWPEVAGNAPVFLGNRMQRSNFADSFDTNEGETLVKSNSSYYDVLYEMCKYYGWTLCSDGANIIFLTPGQSRYNYCWFQDIGDIENYGADYVSVSSKSVASSSLESLTYLSALHNERVLQPVKSVSIIGNINPYGDFDPQYPKEVVTKWIEEHLNNISWRDIGEIRQYTRNFYPPTSVSASGGEYVSYSNEVVEMRLWEYGRGETTHYGRIASIDRTPIEDVGNKIDYNWKDMLVAGLRPNMNQPAIQLLSKRDITLGTRSGGINLFYRMRDNMAGKGSLIWKVRIGDYYWNGSGWTNAESTFTIGWKTEDAETGEKYEIASNRTLGDGYNGVKGMVFPINQTLSGKMEISLVGVEATGIDAMYFEEFSLQYVKYNSSSKSATELPKEVKEKKSCNSDAVSSYNETCMFATSPKTNGYGAVLTHSNIPLSYYSYGTGYVMPETRRANVHYNERLYSRSILSIDIDDGGIMNNRCNVIHNYYPIATSHNWRDNVITLTLIEV